MIRNVLNSVLHKLRPCGEPVSNYTVRTISTGVPYFREVIDRKEMLKAMPAIDEGTAGEKARGIDISIQDKRQLFPTADSENRLFGGVAFKNLPIVNIRVTHNNTIINFTDAKGSTKLLRSCGMEGFKNTRKGTNIAAQTTAITFGGKVLEKGIKLVRVRVRGLGPGRMSSIKGLQMSGLNIVSITDNTRVSWNPPRPRKQRKL